MKIISGNEKRPGASIAALGKHQQSLTPPPPKDQGLFSSALHSHWDFHSILVFTERPILKF